MPKKKLPTLKQLQSKADKLLQTKGRKVFDKCEICGAPIHCLHHFFTKSSSARLRYEWDNMIPICQGCHFKHHTSFDPHINVTILRKRGFDWYDNLVEIKKQSVKTNRVYYNNILKKLLSSESDFKKEI